MAQTLLLLDDSPLVLAKTSEALESAGLRVVSTDDPAVFFAKLSSEHPDLALVDVSMPAMEGDSVVWIARAHRLHSCPIIFYSAKPEAELSKLVRQAGADGFICKTEDETELVRQARRFLAQSPR